MASNGGLINLGVGLKLEIQPVANLRARRGDDTGQRPGTFTSAGQTDQLIANKQVGTYLRAVVGLRVQNKIDSHGRKAASTGRLYRATIDPGNERITKGRIEVGIATHLNSMGAKYYRTFEEGSAFWGFTGTPLFFVSGGQRGGGRTPFPVAHGETPGIRTSKNGRAMFRVTHEIAPANSYRDVFREFTPQVAVIGSQWAARYLDRTLAREVVVAGKDFVPPSA